MTHKSTLDNPLAGLRRFFGHGWMVIAFGAVYLISQIGIGVLVHHAGTADVLRLQVSAFTADDYIETFRQWSAAGVMPFYRAHFMLDDIHWLWYTLSLLALLSVTMNRAGVSASYNRLLLMPLIAGPCDALENIIQHIFLSQPDYVTIIAPLPLISTLASITKWSLAGASLLAVVVIFIKGTNKGVKS